MICAGSTLPWLSRTEMRPPSKGRFQIFTNTISSRWNGAGLNTTKTSPPASASPRLETPPHQAPFPTPAPRPMSDAVGSAAGASAEVSTIPARARRLRVRIMPVFARFS